MGVQPPAFPPRPAPESGASSLAAEEQALGLPVLPISPAEGSALQRAAASPRGRGSWFGWAVAGVLVALGVGFYAFAYVPMQAELARAKRDSASQAEQQSAALTSLQADLQRTRSNLEQQLAAAVQAVSQPPEEPVKVEKPARRVQPALEPRAKKEEPLAAEPEAPAAPNVQRAERPAHATKHKTEPAEPKATSRAVDREAAAAATAELEAQVYGSATPAAKAPDVAAQPAAPAARTAPKAAAEPAAPAPSASKEPLSDVENEPSDDPLEGL